MPGCGDGQVTNISAIMKDLYSLSTDVRTYNWYRPMVDFVTKKTHVWRFEDGIGDEFSSWISGIVGVDIKMDKDLKYLKHPKMREDSPDSRLKKTDALIDNLKVFYRKDFSKFYQDNESTKLDSSLQKGEKTKT